MKTSLRAVFSLLYPFLARAWNGLTAPHATVTEVGARRQAQFSAAIALLLCVILFLQISVALATRRVELGITLATLCAGVLLGYGLSRSASPYAGPALMVFGFTLFAFALTGRRASDAATTLYGMIPIAYILAGVLLSLRWQIALVALVMAGSVALGATPTAPGVNMNLLGGNLVALGVVLIFTSKLRDGIERRRLNQLRQINRDLEATRDALAHERTHLSDSEARTRALLAAVPDMIFELSRGGVLLDFIPSQTLAPQLPPERFLGRNIAEVMPPEIAAASHRAVQRALDSAEVQTFEYQLPEGDTRRTFEARVAASRPDAALAIVRDITERKQAEAALKCYAEQAQRRAEQLATMNEISRAVTALQDLESVLKLIYRQAQRIALVDTFYICLYDPENEQITFPLVYDMGRHYTEPTIPLKPDSRIAGVIHTGKPFMLHRTMEELRMPPDPSLGIGNRQRRAASILTVPLAGGAGDGRVVGSKLHHERLHRRACRNSHRHRTSSSHCD